LKKAAKVLNATAIYTFDVVLMEATMVLAGSQTTKALSGSEIRDKFISYFRDTRAHLNLPSASLIPDNPTLLLTSAGMVPFVPYFLGQAPAPAPRIVTCQKVTRAGGKDSDIENIGRTQRHHSFFEMLGNFSFGDYFKKEVIPWAWEFVTKTIGLDAERISVTIFGGDELNPADEEAFDIWSKAVGIPSERIIRMSRKDNFWGPPGPTGPCGPCSELYYDRGREFGCNDDAEKCGIGKCECDRYLEFWNLVFMEMFKDENGAYTPLAKKNVDTGAGLERLATILQGKNNSFETDLLFPILQEVGKLANASYGQDALKDMYLKIVTDHARCVTFLITDGVRMSNVGRGYVLRFITRRAARFGRLLGLEDPFIFKLVPKVVELYKGAYPELEQHQTIVTDTIRTEEERFAKTIDRGMVMLNELLAGDAKVIPGDKIFDLYATYGFPLELTEEIAKEQGKDIDHSGFAKAREQHEKVSAGNKFNVIMTGSDALSDVIRKHGGTKFTGYDGTQGKGNVLAIVHDNKLVDHVEEGQEVQLVLDQTPFYGESGGQVGDTGMLEHAEAVLRVLDTKKQEGLHIHKVRAISGVLEPEQAVTAMVDKDRREQIMLHHSTAHLFHAAVRELLGKQVSQAGSQVGPDAMRFDFSFERQMTPDEIAQVENLMNEWVRQNLPVNTKELGLEEAKRTGAIAMFGEKYSDVVRVVGMGDISLEFCGGTHVSNTGQIGPVKIVTEGSIASGVRRVEAYSGPKAWEFISGNLRALAQAAGVLKAKPMELASQIERLQDQLKAREKQLAALEEKLALAQSGTLLNQAQKIGSVEVIAAQVEGVSAEGLKTLAENLRAVRGSMVVALATKLADDKVSIVVGVSDDVAKKFNAGNLVKEAAAICGGGGGGRPNLAQAGGKDPAKIKQALDAVVEAVKKSS
jgi:alanyl-tRNA synthetase